MRKITRRYFVISAAALPVGCAADRRVNAPAAPVARAPALGQSWTYAKRDLFTKVVVDQEIDQIAEIGRSIEIDSRTAGAENQAGDPAAPETPKWWHRYFSRPKPAGRLPGEVQEPWGKVRVDPHWGQVQVFDAPIFLWPARLDPGWEQHFTARYRTSEEQGAALPWIQIMKAEAWETILVPAGKFKALRYLNIINFQNSDPARTHSVRRETIWFAPEIGRWAARESKGTYYMDDSISDDEYQEGSFRWELLAWT